VANPLETEPAVDEAQPFIRIFNYSRDFEDLWCRALITDDPPFGELTDLVVLWDGQSQSGLAGTMLLPHLTPLDWALLYSIRACDGPARGGVSIHIVDLTGALFREAYAIRQRHQWLVEMPWVGLYGALTPAEMARMHHRKGYGPLYSNGDTGGSLLRPARGSGVGFEFNASHGLARLPRKPDVRLRERLTDLLGAWAASLPNSRDHHDLNNIVGPMLFNELIADHRMEARAVHQKIQCLPWWGTLRESLPSDGIFDWSRRDQWFKRPLSVVVVDDQVKAGWGDFVNLIFGNPDAASADIVCWDSPKELVEFLATRAQFGVRDFSSAVRLQRSEKPDRPEIVFLDLRLTGSDGELKEQARKLCTIARSRLHTVKRPAWKVVDPIELERIARWCDGQRVDDVERAKDGARLLLPMLLAQALPLTPIIMFSSTGKSWIKEHLKQYRNIITGFEKPRVLGGRDTAQIALDALQAALANSVGMMRLRLQLAHVQKAVAKDVRPSPMLGQHVEIYADEWGLAAGSEGEPSLIGSGIAFCGFSSREVANKLQARFYKEFEKDDASLAEPATRVVWMPRNPNPPALEEFVDTASRARNPNWIEPAPVALSKRFVDVHDVTRQVELLADFLDPVVPASNRGSWTAVSTFATDRTQEPGVRTLRGFPDRALDQLLRFNIEFALFVLIPYLSNQMQRHAVTVGLYVPTRVAKLGDRDQARELSRAFQLGQIFGDGLKTYDASKPEANPGQRFNTVFPVVRGWLAEWCSVSAPEPKMEIVAVRSASLVSDGTPYMANANDARDRRFFHEVADWVCTAAKPRGPAKALQDQLRHELERRQIFNTWMKSSDHTGAFSGTLLVLMAALRNFDSGDAALSNVESLRLVVRAKAIAEVDDSLFETDALPQRLLLWALRSVVNDASGNVLMSAMN
jgi:hypothetical protein